MSDEQNEAAEGSESDVERLVMPDYRVLHDNFTEIVAYQMYYFDKLEETEMASFTYNELKSMEEKAIDKYQNDYVFSARVKSMVSMLIRSTQEEHDNRIAGLPFKRFRIVEA